MMSIWQLQRRRVRSCAVWREKRAFAANSGCRRLMERNLPRIDASRRCDRRGGYGEGVPLQNSLHTVTGPSHDCGRARQRASESQRPLSLEGRNRGVSKALDARSRALRLGHRDQCGVEGSTFRTLTPVVSTKRLHSTAFYYRPRLPSSVPPSSSLFPSLNLHLRSSIHCLVPPVPSVVDPSCVDLTL